MSLGLRRPGRQTVFCTTENSSTLIGSCLFRSLARELQDFKSKAKDFVIDTRKIIDIKSLPILFFDWNKVSLIFAKLKPIL